MKRIAVLVSGGGTNLQALIDKEITNGEIVLVVSNNSDAYALKRAKAAHIKSAVLVKEKIYSVADYDKRLIKVLLEEKIDLVVLAGFMSILGNDFIKEFKNRIINIHPSLIPSFCGKGFYGLRIHERVLEYGVKITGATVHFVNEIPDGGEIILQKAVEVSCDDTKESLQKKVMEQAEWKILPEAVNLFCSDRLEIINRTVIIKQ